MVKPNEISELSHDDNKIRIEAGGLILWFMKIIQKRLPILVYCRKYSIINKKQGTR